MWTEFHGIRSRSKFGGVQAEPMILFYPLRWPQHFVDGVGTPKMPQPVKVEIRSSMPSESRENGEHVQRKDVRQKSHGVDLEQRRRNSGQGMITAIFGERNGRTQPTQEPPATRTTSTHDTSSFRSAATVRGSWHHFTCAALNKQVGHSRICAVCIAVDAVATATINSAGTAGMPPTRPKHMAWQKPPSWSRLQGHPCSDAPSV